MQLIKTIQVIERYETAISFFPSTSTSVPVLTQAELPLVAGAAGVQLAPSGMTIANRAYVSALVAQLVLDLAMLRLARLLSLQPLIGHAHVRLCAAT